LACSGLTILEEYGGLDLTMEEEALVMVLGQTSPAFRSLFGTTVGIGSQGILLDGLDWQRREYTELRALDGELSPSLCSVCEAPGSLKRRLYPWHSRAGGGAVQSIKTGP
jgi:acyl-CoA dehydrogenase